MKIKSRVTYVEKIAFLIALFSLIASACLIIFFDRIFSQPSIAPEDIIANISIANNSVKRRTPTVFDFSSVRPGDPLGNGDVIFSGALSNAVVKFKEGSTLAIGPDSLVVIRFLDGEIDVKLEKGSVSGKLKKDTDMTIHSDEDSIALRGPNDSGFRLYYVPNVGLVLKNSPIVSSRPDADDYDNPKGEKRNEQEKPDPNESVTPSGPDRPPEKPIQPIQRVKMADFRFDDTTKVGERRSVSKTPYPSERSVILHKNEFSLPIFPKPRCESHCRLDVYLDNSLYFSREFDQHKVPIVYVKIAKTVQGTVQWILRDQDTQTRGRFEVLSYSEENIAAALQQGHSIEVVD